MAGHDLLFPHAQDKLCIALSSFAQAVAADAPAAGLSESDAVTLVRLASEFEEALALTRDMCERTPDSIARKDEVRARALKAFRLAAGQIEANPNVAVEVKRRLGMKVDEHDIAGRARSKKRIETPMTVPLLTFIGSVPERGHRLRFADLATPDSPAKPHGVARLDLRAAIHGREDVITDPDLATIALDGVTRSPFWLPMDLGVPAGAGGGAAPHQQVGLRLATRFGRWSTRTKLKGPWSQPVTLVGV